MNAFIESRASGVIVALRDRREGKRVIVNHILRDYVCVKEDTITRETLDRYGVDCAVETIDNEFYGVMLKNGVCVLGNGSREYILDRLVTPRNKIGDLRCIDIMYFVKDSNRQ